jgi:hypothetical protein
MAVQVVLRSLFVGRGADYLTIVQIAREEGIRRFYKGLSVSYLGVTEGTTRWVLYECLKRLTARERAVCRNGLACWAPPGRPSVSRASSPIPTRSVPRCLPFPNIFFSYGCRADCCIWLPCRSFKRA